MLIWMGPVADDDAIMRKLDFMRADIEEPGSSPAGRLIAGHAALLLAAVEAVLKLAHSAEPAYWGARRLGWTLDPAKVREAITRELTGKEESDAET